MLPEASIIKRILFFVSRACDASVDLQGKFGYQYY